MRGAVGRTGLARFGRRQGFSCLIRAGPEVTVRVKGFHGKRLDYPAVKRGAAKAPRDVACRADGAVTRHVVAARRQPGPPPERDECRFPATDLIGTAHPLCRRYARRTTIEQLFRDGKSRRNGWPPPDTQLSTPGRLDRRRRLPLVSAIAYLPPCGPGPVARQAHKPAARCPGSKEQCSIFRVGRAMIAKLRAPPARAFAAVRQLSESLAEKWG